MRAELKSANFDLRQRVAGGAGSSAVQGHMWWVWPVAPGDIVLGEWWSDRIHFCTPTGENSSGCGYFTVPVNLGALRLGDALWTVHNCLKTQGIIVGCDWPHPLYGSQFLQDQHKLERISCPDG